MRFDLSQLRAATARRDLALGFVMGALLGAGIGVGILLINYRGSLGFASELKEILGVAIAIGLIVPLTMRDSLSGLPAAVSRPSELVAQGLIHDLAIPLVSGLGWGVAAGLAPTLFLGSTEVLTRGIISSVGYAFAIGFAFGAGLGTMFVSSSPWPRYFSAARILSRRQELPARPALFLDWAYRAGLLRLAGIAVQFRHRDLQDQLTKSPAFSSHTRGHLDPRPDLSR